MIILAKENQRHSMVKLNVDRKIGRSWNLRLLKYWQRAMLVIAFDQYFFILLFEGVPILVFR